MGYQEINGYALIAAQEAVTVNRGEAQDNAPLASIV